MPSALAPKILNRRHNPHKPRSKSPHPEPLAKTSSSPALARSEQYQLESSIHYMAQPDHALICMAQSTGRTPGTATNTKPRKTPTKKAGGYHRRRRLPPSRNRLPRVGFRRRISASGKAERQDGAPPAAGGGGRRLGGVGGRGGPKSSGEVQNVVASAAGDSGGGTGGEETAGNGPRSAGGGGERAVLG